MEMILLTKEQADTIRGNYGKYSALDPIQVVEGWALPIDVLNDPEFLAVHDILVSYPIQNVTIIKNESPL
jgi:hypothetical protein